MGSFFWLWHSPGKSFLGMALGIQGGRAPTTAKAECIKLGSIGAGGGFFGLQQTAPGLRFLNLSLPHVRSPRILNVGQELAPAGE
jgi:hypothetical protein